ncbi:hypothetical protein V6C27_06660 [Peptococcaceae bacterium 1198_IL3148]
MRNQTKLLNRSNNELDKQLNDENSKVMTDMVCYLRVANISEYQQEMIRQDLLEMVLSAQARGDDIKTVIGKDYKSFCDEVIASLPQKSIKEQVLDYLDIFLLCTAILATINVVFSKTTIDLLRNLLTDQPLNFQMPVTIGSLLSYCIILMVAIAIVNFIGKTAFKPEKEHPQNKLKRFMLGGFIGSGVMTIFLLIAWFGKQTLFTVNIFVASAFILLLYVGHILLQNITNP